MIVVLLLLLGAINTYSRSHCGYESCHAVNNSKINVHLVPHSHNDVGWLKTVDEYYYGMGGSVGVKYIITSVIQALEKNSDRRFILVETAYFWKWWKEADTELRIKLQSLVNNGQIEIVNGGWVMNDEACTSYQSIIDQFTWGLRKINETLGECGKPKIGWQIDPFGHSREQASIYSQMGFEGNLFSRIDENDLKTRKKEKTLEFIWKASASLEKNEIFSSVMPHHYGSPSGFCWDYFCTNPDQPLVPDASSMEYNVPEKVLEFEEVIENYTSYAVTNNVLIPLGGDFEYEQAEMHFINLDLLIRAFTNHSKYNVIYSTPSCYVKAVNLAEPNLSIKTDDFFPYATDIHSFWTGFYTSRPNSKLFERTAHSILQAAKQLTSIYQMVNGISYDENLEHLRESVGTMQHHDAISGTERQNVVENYVELLSEGIREAEKPMGLIIGNLLRKDSKKDLNLNLTTCLLSNISICEISSSAENFIVAVYNPFSKPITHYVRLPASNSSYKIIGPNGDEAYDLVKSISDFTFVNDGTSPSQTELVFSARNISALGINLYYVEKQKGSGTFESFSQSTNFIFGTDAVNFQLDQYTHLLKSVSMNNVTLDISQGFYYYSSENGENEGVASGAYVFRPIKGTEKATKVTEKPAIIDFSIKGNIVHEVHLKIADWIKQIIRVYTGQDNNFIEFDWLVGPINVNETTRTGKEIITKFVVDNFNNTGVFYTDSNGREMIKRSRREYSNTNVESISSNYYPVTAAIVIKDETRKMEMAILNDRPQGGTSLIDGEIELMIHRRILVDDSKGLDEPLNEIEFGDGVRVRGKHFLVIGSTEKTESFKSTAAHERELMQRNLLSPLILVGGASTTGILSDDFNKTANLQYNFLKTQLPDNINILTLETWQDGTYLLRLEHIMGENEETGLANGTIVDLNGLFVTGKITKIKETLLGANIWLEDWNVEDHLAWNTTTSVFVSDAHNDLGNSDYHDEEAMKITLKPMQIRTFVITVK